MILRDRRVSTERTLLILNETRRILIKARSSKFKESKLSVWEKKVDGMINEVITLKNKEEMLARLLCLIQAERNNIQELVSLENLSSPELIEKKTKMDRYINQYIILNEGL